MNATVWYTDQRIDVSSVDEWTAAPDIGVICVMEHFENGTHEIHANAEFYYYDPHIHRVCRTKGWDAATACPPPPHAVGVKRAPAAMIPDAEYEAIKDAAMAEVA